MFRNRQQLIENASTEKLRKMRVDALTVMETALNAVDPMNAVMEKLQVIDGNVVVDGFTKPLD
ncbi:hypothetical protein KAU18_10300, partial [Candidatus Bathyarchaeota archaeon]|nr:hypothetical protein [Candidatus Bathyarchaeota archaeon]